MGLSHSAIFSVFLVSQIPKCLTVSVSVARRVRVSRALLPRPDETQFEKIEICGDVGASEKARNMRKCIFLCLAFWAHLHKCWVNHGLQMNDVHIDLPDHFVCLDHTLFPHH